MLPVIDAHHHPWQLSGGPLYYPWLTLYRMLAHLGHTELDTAAVLKLYERD